MRPEKSYPSLAGGTRGDRSTAGRREKPCQWLGSLRARLLYLAFLLSLFCCCRVPLPNLRIHAMRNAVIAIMARYAALTPARTDRQQVAE